MVLPSFDDIGEITEQLRQEPTTCPGLVFIICVDKEDGEEEEDVSIWNHLNVVLRERAEITGKLIRILGRNAEINDPEFRKHFTDSKIYPSMPGKDKPFAFSLPPVHSCRVFKRVKLT